MQTFLYVETNFIMAVATGRDPEAMNLLIHLPPVVKIWIPSVCFREAIVALENEKKSRKEFRERLNVQITEARRNLALPAISSLINHLEWALVYYDQMLNDIQSRFNQAFELLARKSGQIHPDSSILQQSLSPILEHSRQNPTVQRVLLTDNFKEFDRTEVKSALQQAGISRSFRLVKNFQGWLKSQPPRKTE